jgi:hypothetical protein
LIQRGAESFAQASRKPTTRPIPQDKVLTTITVTQCRADQKIQLRKHRLRQ